MGETGRLAGAKAVTRRAAVPPPGGSLPKRHCPWRGARQHSSSTVYGLKRFLRGISSGCRPAGHAPGCCRAQPPRSSSRRSSKQRGDDARGKPPHPPGCPPHPVAAGHPETLRRLLPVQPLPSHSAFAAPDPTPSTPDRLLHTTETQTAPAGQPRKALTIDDEMTCSAADVRHKRYNASSRVQWRGAGAAGACR